MSTPLNLCPLHFQYRMKINFRNMNCLLLVETGEANANQAISRYKKCNFYPHVHYVSPQKITPDQPEMAARRLKLHCANKLLWHAYFKFNFFLISFGMASLCTIMAMVFSLI